MKTFFYAAISVFLLASCTDITRKDIDFSSIPVLHEKFNIHNIDSTKILNPGGIYCYKDYVVIIPVGGINLVHT